MKIKAKTIKMTNKMKEDMKMKVTMKR